MTTVFQKIINREIPAEILFEDDICISIKDIEPQAPFHALIIPKKVITRVGEADNEDDLVEEITSASGWCIKSIDYEIQLK